MYNHALHAISTHQSMTPSHGLVPLNILYYIQLIILAAV